MLSAHATRPLYAPPAPFADWPQHLVLTPHGQAASDRLYFWWSETARTLVTCFQTEVVDIPVARAVVCGIDRCVEEKRELIESEGVNAVQDWRWIRSFPIEARRYQLERAEQNLLGLNIHDSSVAVEMNPIKRMGVSVLAMTLSLITNHTMRVVPGNQLGQELDRHQVEIAAAPPFVLRLRQKLRGIDFERRDPTPL